MQISNLFVYEFVAAKLFSQLSIHISQQLIILASIMATHHSDAEISSVRMREISILFTTANVAL